MSIYKRRRRKTNDFCPRCVGPLFTVQYSPLRNRNVINDLQSHPNPATENRPCKTQ
jgi:hypothetical protein